MPLIFGSFLAGSLMSFLIPVSLLICFAVFFYRQWRRQGITEIKPTTPEPPASPAQPYSGQPSSNS